MAESDTIFSSKVKYNGLFDFKDFYRFAYSWLSEEMGLGVSEGKYVEKLKGDSKDIEIEWNGTRKVTDYFKFEVNAKIIVMGMTTVEINKDGKKAKMNNGSIEISVQGNLIRDYQGKFEMTAFQKFLRSIYEKWVIPSRISQYSGKLIGSCDEFLGQIKAYLDLEGKK
ncbi:MAG TPA: hypothetical protein VJB35_00845 [Candidatus Nanoarchaeia archaeon]|nr:hypothetical protein [Candidatus Nanoarchaeia archaeon]